MFGLVGFSQKKKMYLTRITSNAMEHYSSSRKKKGIYSFERVHTLHSHSNREIFLELNSTERDDGEHTIPD